MILDEHHPDEGDEDFVAKGRVTGTFQLLNRTSYVRLIFNYNQDDGSYDYIEVKWGESRTFQFRLVREGTTSSTKTVVVNNQNDLKFFCLHFDQDGTIVFRVSAINGADDVFWVTSIAPGIGGGVGYARSDVQVTVSITAFHRAASEHVAELDCESCLGDVCDPCCPEGAAVSWLASFAGGMTNGTYNACGNIDGNYILEATAACNWLYTELDPGADSGPPSGFMDENTFLCGDNLSVGPVRAWVEMRMRIGHLSSGQCVLQLDLTLFYFRVDGQVVCQHVNIGRWRSFGEYHQLCQGTHVLALVDSDPIACGGIPGAVTVRSL